MPACMLQRFPLERQNYINVTDFFDLLDSGKTFTQICALENIKTNQFPDKYSSFDRGTATSLQNTEVYHFVISEAGKVTAVRRPLESCWFMIWIHENIYIARAVLSSTFSLHYCKVSIEFA